MFRYGRLQDCIKIREIKEARLAWQAQRRNRERFWQASLKSSLNSQINADSENNTHIEAGFQVTQIRFKLDWSLLSKSRSAQKGSQSRDHSSTITSACFCHF